MKLKAAIINMFIVTIDQMVLCDVKGVHCDKPTEQYHQLCSFPQFQEHCSILQLSVLVLEPETLLDFTVVPRHSKQLF